MEYERHERVQGLLPYSVAKRAARQTVQLKAHSYPQREEGLADLVVPQMQSDLHSQRPLRS